MPIYTHFYFKENSCYLAYCLIFYANACMKHVEMKEMTLYIYK